MSAFASLVSYPHREEEGTVYTEWSVVDGPPDLTSEDVGQERTFFVESDNVRRAVTLLIHQVGPMFGGTIKSIAGMLTDEQHRYDAIGTYNIRDRTGHFHAVRPEL